MALWSALRTQPRRVDVAYGPDGLVDATAIARRRAALDNQLAAAGGFTLLSATQTVAQEAAGRMLESVGSRWAVGLNLARDAYNLEAQMAAFEEAAEALGAADLGPFERAAAELGVWKEMVELFAAVLGTAGDAAAALALLTSWTGVGGLSFGALAAGCGAGAVALDAAATSLELAMADLVRAAALSASTPPERAQALVTAYGELVAEVGTGIMDAGVGLHASLKGLRSTRVHTEQRVRTAEASATHASSAPAVATPPPGARAGEGTPATIPAAEVVLPAAPSRLQRLWGRASGRFVPQRVEIAVQGGHRVARVVETRRIRVAGDFNPDTRREGAVAPLVLEALGEGFALSERIAWRALRGPGGSSSGATARRTVCLPPLPAPPDSLEALAALAHDVAAAVRVEQALAAALEERGAALDALDGSMASDAPIAHWENVAAGLEAQAASAAKEADATVQVAAEADATAGRAAQRAQGAGARADDAPSAATEAVLHVVRTPFMRGLAEGALTVAELAAEVAQACASLFGADGGVDPAAIERARAVLAAGQRAPAARQGVASRGTKAAAGVQGARAAGRAARQQAAQTAATAHGHVQTIAAQRVEVEAWRAAVERERNQEDMAVASLRARYEAARTWRHALVAAWKTRWAALVAWAAAHAMARRAQEQTLDAARAAPRRGEVGGESVATLQQAAVATAAVAAGAQRLAGLVAAGASGGREERALRREVGARLDALALEAARTEESLGADDASQLGEALAHAAGVVEVAARGVQRAAEAAGGAS